MNITIRKYDPRDKKKWDDFLNNIQRAHFFFKRDYMDYHSDRFEDHSLMLFKEDELKAVLPANIKDDELHSHQGLTFGSLLTDGLGAKDHVACFEILKTHCKENGINMIHYKCLPAIYSGGVGQEDLYALTQTGFNKWRRDINTVVDLRKEIKLRKDKRRNSNKGKRLELIIEEQKEYSSYWGILEEILEKHHQAKPTHTIGEMEQLASSFPENIKHYLLKDSTGNPIGGVVLFINGRIVHTQYMSVNDHGRKIGALDYLIVQLMEKYKLTHDYFSFGISTEENGQTLNEGLIFQKEGFGGSGVVHDFYKLEL